MKKSLHGNQEERGEASTPTREGKEKKKRKKVFILPIPDRGPISVFSPLERRGEKKEEKVGEERTSDIFFHQGGKDVPISPLLPHWR